MVPFTFTMIQGDVCQVALLHKLAPWSGTNNKLWEFT